MVETFSDTVTVVAKGPSAEKATEFIEMVYNTDVAVINDAGLLVEGTVDWCFFTDSYMLNWIGQDHTIRRFVHPEFPEDLKKGLPKWFQFSNAITYSDRECDGDVDSLCQRILSGGICHHHTTPGAIHWLVKVAGYERIRIIGVDGGRRYAEGVGTDEGSRQRLVDSHGGDLNFLDTWKEITHRVVNLMQNVYGVEVEWYGL